MEPWISINEHSEEDARLSKAGSGGSQFIIREQQSPSTNR